MKEIFKNQLHKAQIDKIHLTLYKFSSAKMFYLDKLVAYKQLMADFIKCSKEDLLANNTTMSKMKEDYEAGFVYIKTFSKL